ncbi:MAG: tetratricopeptide repeat protein [Nitrospinae bacterium]|nr:tetratricopeptide repeat protein [Nitrospinota bacterium]
MKIFIVSEKNYEIKQVRDFLGRLPFGDFGKGNTLDFYQEENPKTALEKLEKNAADGIGYDLIIVSQKMKALPGIRFARSVTARKTIASAPVMLVVDNLNKELVTEAMGAGVSGFFTMPFVMDEMRTALMRLATILLSRARKKISDAMEQAKATSAKTANPEILEQIHRKGTDVIERCAMYAPWSEEVHTALAAMHIEHGDFAFAIPKLKLAIKINPNNRDTHRQLLACYKKNGQAMEESATLKKLLATNPSSPDLLTKLGDSILHEGNYKEAALYFKKAIANHKPGDPARLKAKSHVGLGKAFMAEGDELSDPAKHEMAKNEFAAAATTDPTLVSAYLNLIASYKKLGLQAEAKAAAAKAAAIAPDNAEGWLDLFSHYLGEGEVQKAKFSLQRAIQYDPENQITLVRAGQMYFLNRMFGEAAGLFEKAAEVNPSDTRTFNFLGICYRRMEMFEQAVANFKKAINLDPEDYNLYFNLGRACQQANDTAKAREAYATALKLNADFEEAKEALASLSPAVPAGAEKAATAG